MIDNFDHLPVLKTFKGLERGVKVYSKKHGIGTVFSLYHEDQIIVQFSRMRLRFSALDEEIARIPDDRIVKPSTKMEVYVKNKKVSFKKFKEQRKLDERRKANQKILDEIHEINAKRAKDKLFE